MELFVLSSIWFALVVFFILRALRQQRIHERVRLAASIAGEDAPPVCVIVPARDERANIASCVRSLLRQRYPRDRLRIIVTDDNSSDGTADIVAAMAAADERLTLVRAPALPPGWKGKTHACAIAAARAADARWLCFIDADMSAHPLLIGSAVNAAQAGGIDLLSLSPRQELVSFAERLVMPCGFYLLAFSQDLAEIQAPDSGDVVATGQFLLARRDVYEALGGHSAVRGEICEDVELARLIKTDGHRVLLEDGSKLLSTRMYTGWSTLWPGIAKNLSDMLGGPVRTVATALIAIVMAWAAFLLPVIDLIACSGGSHDACMALVPALLGSAAAFGLHLAGTGYFAMPFWYGLLFPLGYSAGAALALDSLRWRLKGRIRWKGRVYQ